MAMALALALAMAMALEMAMTMAMAMTKKNNSECRTRLYYLTLDPSGLRKCKKHKGENMTEHWIRVPEWKA